MAQNEKLHVVHMIKKDGKVWGYGLSDGRNVSRAEGVSLARNGFLSDVAITLFTKEEYLSSLPDDGRCNLGELPVVEWTD